MKIEIKGPIISDGEQWIYDWFEIPATSPSSVAKQMKKASNNEQLEIHINSGGGSVFSGSEIYTMLKDYKGDVIVKIVGVAASAASVIAMSGKKIMMSPTGQIMIHNASTSGRGDHNEHQHTATLLKTIDESIANSYRLRTGMSQEELLGLMEQETWLSPQKALNYKFIDEIMFDNEKILNSMSAIQLKNDGTLPQEVIDKVRNELKKMPNVVNEMPMEPVPEVKNKEQEDKIKLLKAKIKLRIL
ncbi:MAG: head maturation protease, ClpP-related [Cetobacterium sp.]|uniref:head maturation protease, ClpP-related n=1 Tax=Cetobacterium sp. TaxID=2071632 RepID=UPI003F384401